MPENSRTLGTPAAIALHDLTPDPSNPRLPPLPLGSPPRTEDDLLETLANVYDAFEVAESIAANRYWHSEPIIVIKSDSSVPPFVVAEGNRRLTALKLLAEPDLVARLELDDHRWQELTGTAALPAEIPCVTVESWDEVAAIIGYRHISGVVMWDPLQKARYIERLAARADFAEVSRMTGISETEVRSQYRNERVFAQLTRQGIDTAGAADDFGTFTLAMTRTGIREYIEAPTPAEVTRERDPLPETPNVREHARELLSWLFGEPGKHRVIGESRDVTDLARVLSEPLAVEELRTTRNLESALTYTSAPRDRIMTGLAAAYRSLLQVEGGIADFANDDAVMSRLTDCRGALARLEAAVQQ